MANMPDTLKSTSGEEESEEEEEECNLTFHLQDNLGGGGAARWTRRFEGFAALQRGTSQTCLAKPDGKKKQSPGTEVTS